MTTTVELLHHSAAASSSTHTLVWMPEEEEGLSSIVYSSHGVLNICRQSNVQLSSSSSTIEPVWSVHQTLRTTSVGGDESSKRVVTALCDVKDTEGKIVGLASGYSDGTVNLWRRTASTTADEWSEQILQEANTSPSITDIDGMLLGDTIMVVICTSTGVFTLEAPDDNSNTTTTVASYAANTVRLEHFGDGWTMLLVGTAAPRHNKIHVYWMDNNQEGFRHAGHLVGHEDWLTDFALDTNSSVPLLASASQDARIRLWEFKTTLGEVPADEMMAKENDTSSDADESSNDDLDVDEMDDEGEARLEIVHSQGITRVTLEALLYGHEEPVTSVAWYPKPQELYRQDRVLLSSSMDRTLLIWTCIDVWAPLQRVGAAGGILGGSIGSTLLGFLGVAIDPVAGASLVGHAYGGALHVWTLEQGEENEAGDEISTEELGLRNKWKATPCITGHFDGVTDCCWEASNGDYLLTVSSDQTCRLWAPVVTTDGNEIWVELARPQVHGYDLTTVTSLSTPSHRHVIVSGADEKEIRVFDAPLNAVKMLRAANNEKESTTDEGLERVERAYIPSLGLSNKASAADGADEDTEGVEENAEDVHLPLERDLGAVSLWPEVGKLYGHNTELYCLSSTLSAQSGKPMEGPFANEALVASCAKARDVQDASVRIWTVESGKCVQVLAGGHKSTVATLAFSPDGHYLASSGKDRRLCIWSRRAAGESDDEKFVLSVGIDSAHKRIIWCSHFCPFDASLLATGSRDGTIKVWRITKADDGSVSADVLHAFEPSFRTGKKAESVTALSFAPIATEEQKGILAVGLENGLIEIWGVGNECSLLHSIEPSSCHFATVTKLCWRPVRLGNDGTLILASSSTDHGCRLFKLKL